MLEKFLRSLIGLKTISNNLNENRPAGDSKQALNKKNIYQDFDFINKENTNEILNKKAKLLSGMIEYVAWKDVGHFTDDIIGDEAARKIDWIDLISETVIFYIHYADRIAHKVLDGEKRNYFIDKLIIDSEKLLAIDLPNLSKFMDNFPEKYYAHNVNKQDFSAYFLKKFNEKQLEYSQYRDSFLEGTDGKLQLKFATNIAKIIGKEKNLEAVMLCEMFACSSLAFFQFECLLSDRLIFESQSDTVE